jgi:hypothetical protein
VLVPEAEPAIGSWRRRHSRDGAAGMPAHVTLLYPFPAEPDLDALRAIAAGSAPFRFALRRVHEWPDGVVYLEPEPPEPFTRLTVELVDRFPDHQPYGGAFTVDHYPALHGRAHGRCRCESRRRR